MHNNRDQAWIALQQPDTDAQTLAQIAATHPEFAQAIATHPNSYSELQAWALARLAPPVPQTATARLTPRRSVLWVIAYAAVAVILPAHSVIYTLSQHFGFSEALSIYSFWFYTLFTGLVIGTVALIASPTSKRKAAAASLTFGPMLVIVLLWIITYVTSNTYLFDVLFLAWGNIQLEPILLSIGAALAYAVGRPVRGFGWITVPFVALLPDILSSIFLRLFPTTTIGSIDFWLVLLNLIYAMVLISGVFATEALTRASERAALRKPPLVPDAAPPRTNVLAILTLVFAVFSSLLAVVFGHIALHQVAKTGEQGRSLAIAGLVISYSGIWLSVILGLLWLIGANLSF